MSSDKHHLQSVGGFGGRVGHKAGGFISKKFFHPTNYKNQEKLWAALEEKKEREKRQHELMKKREEERRVELLKQEMSSGSGAGLAAGLNVATGGGLFLSKHGPEDTPALDSVEMRAAHETRRRLEYLANEHRVIHSTATRMNINSRYQEDLHVNGHSTVWGSYFDMTDKVWGYSCCKSVDKSAVCPNRHPKKPKPEGG